MTEIRAEQMRAFAANAPAEMARFCVESFSQMTPGSALDCLELARDALEHDAERHPIDVELSVRIELARGLYAELLQRSGAARESYLMLARWYERFGGFSVAHVDGLLAGLEWAVERQCFDVAWLHSVCELALEQPSAEPAQMREWTERLQWLRERGGLESGAVRVRRHDPSRSLAENAWGVDIVLPAPASDARVEDDLRAVRGGGFAVSSPFDEDRFAHAARAWSLDDGALAAVLGVSEFWIDRAERESSGQREAALRGLGALCLALGFLEAFALARKSLVDPAALGPLREALRSAHRSARRELARKGESTFAVA